MVPFDRPIRALSWTLTLAVGLAACDAAEDPISPQFGKGSTKASVEVWWPTEGARLSGVQPFKARVAGWDLSTYAMYWQVDGGQLNEMADDWTDGPHKESSVDVAPWTWRGEGPYEVRFVAKDRRGKTVGERKVSVYVDGGSTGGGGSGGTTTSTNPFAGASFWVDPNSNAAKTAAEWRATRPADADQMEKIARQPQALWFGNWNADVRQAADYWTTTITNAGALPVYVAYNIPQRDCGGWSAGGSNDPDAYRSWIRAFADGIGARKAVVVLEPDALAGMGCLSSSDQQLRLELLADAVQVLKAKGGISVYIDAGHAYWIAADEMAARLAGAGIAQADGFALNVSNYHPNTDNFEYGKRVSAAVGGKHFIIDTSRNGVGSNGEWCNPDGRALGTNPTVYTGSELVDAFFWIKRPGESDGSCNGGPSAGSWWADYALGLAQRQTTTIASAGV